MKKSFLSLVVLVIAFTSCKKDVIERATPSYVSVKMIDSSSVAKWVEVRPEKTKPYDANGFDGAYSTTANKVSIFNYADTFGGLVLYQTKALKPYRFYVLKNGVKIDEQIRQNSGTFGYEATNGDEFLFVIKDN